MFKKISIIVGIILISGLSGIIADRYIFPRLAATKLFTKYEFLKKSAENVTVINKTEQIVVKEDSSITKIANNITPAIVNILSYQASEGNVPPRASVFKNGTGEIVTSDGIIMTYSDAILHSDLAEEGTAERFRYKVMVSDGNIYDAEILAIDSWSNLTFLKISASNLPVISFGEASRYSPGEKVISIGNNSADYQNHFNAGVLNAYDARYNISGSALSVSEKLEGVYLVDFGSEKLSAGDLIVDYSGQVVGVTGTVTRNNRTEFFGVSSEKVKKILEKAINRKIDSNPYLGIYYVPISRSFAIAHSLKVNEGAMVYSASGQQGLAVLAGSPAQKSGLLINDIILAVDGQEIKGENTLSSLLYDLEKGRKVPFKISRNGQEMEISVQL